MHKYQNWVLATPEADKVNRLAAALEIDPLIATLLVNRGIEEAEAAKCFLIEQWDGEFPRLDGCEAAVRMLQEIRKQEMPVVIYGDYDVDGICSTAIMYECLDYLGYQVSYRLPNRFTDGYGLTAEAVTDIAVKKAGLLLTVDCGISAVDEIQLANELGLRTIITDHHQPGDELPAADVIINPRINLSGEGQELCGAGVAFCLALTLLKEEGTMAYGRRWLDLLALATVADIVPLTGYNRIWVREGLQQMRSRVGIKRLLTTARVREGDLSAYHIGFILAPRLNAAGRLENAEPALELLLTGDERRAEELAAGLDALNVRRQQLEEQIFQQAIRELPARDDELPEVLVLAGEDWHQGVIGIVASRVAQRYQRPAIMIAWGEEVGKGSARSVAGFDMMEVLRQSAASLDQFGGHRGAAGLEISRDQFTAFCQRVNQAAAACYFEPEAVSTIKIDGELPLSRLNLELGQLEHRLRPYGEGNPAPVFQTTASFDRVTRMGKNGEHFKGWLAGVSQAEVLCFREGSLAEQIDCGQYYDLAFTPEINAFNGKRILSLRLLDIRPRQHKKMKSDRPAHPDLITEQPHVVVCPDQRVLDLLWPCYREMYGERAMALCGRSANLSQGMGLLKEGADRIFLTTPVYFPYHIKKFGLPERWAVWLPVGIGAYQASFFEWLTKAGLPWQSLDDPSQICCEIEGDVIYTRPQGQKLYASSAQHVVDETQARQRSKKLLQRQRWINSGGTLLTAGDVLATHAVTSFRLTMATPPLTRGEWQLLQDCFSPRQLTALFPQEAVAANEDYYLGRYPDAALVADVLQYLAADMNKEQTFYRDRLIQEMETALGKPMKWPLLSSILTILAQTGVITARTLHDTVIINKLSNGGQVRLTDSLLYLEGKWELREWLNWKFELQQMAVTGGEEKYGAR